jgi:hypothetical protein
MPDRDPMPDPMDKAYVEAETMLSDDNARAERRARLMDAVAMESAPAAAAAAAAPTPSAPTPRRFSLRRSGWLMAACVAGFGVLLATQFLREPHIVREDRVEVKLEKPPATSFAAVPAQSPTAPPKVARREAPPVIQQREVAAAPAMTPPPEPLNLAAPTAARKAASSSSPVMDAQAGYSDAARAVAPPPPPPPPPPAAQDSIGGVVALAPKATDQSTVQEVVVTGARAAKASGPAENLAEAAGKGRISEVKRLVTQGAQVDAVDADGETALMKSIEADRPAIAAFLVRHGANVDRKNHAGVSAKDMALESKDAALKRAIGVEP